MYFVQKSTNVILFLLTLSAIVLFLCAPQYYAKSILDGIMLWVTAVLPTTFPFLFLSDLLTHSPVYQKLSQKLSFPMKKLFRISGTGGSILLLSALSGYPVGARSLCDQFKQNVIGKTECIRLAPLCSTSGPMFLIGTVGCMLYHNTSAGIVLLIAHLSAVWLTGIVTRFPKSTKTPPGSEQIRAHSASGNIDSTIAATLSIGGFIALFSCFSQMLSDVGLFQITIFGQYSDGILKGLLEMTSGCNALSKIATPVSLACSCALITFGGACVLAQQYTFLSRTGIKFIPFLCKKLIQAIIAFFLCLILSNILPVF